MQDSQVVSRLEFQGLTVPEAVCKCLSDALIDHLFYLPGGYMATNFFSPLSKTKSIRTILVRHEESASMMAEAYGKLTGKPGVFMAQGVWVASHALFGLIEAFKSSTPVLVLTDFTDLGGYSHHAPYQSGTGDYGSYDLRNILKSCTKYIGVPTTPNQAVQMTQLALKHATSGTPGPVAVLFNSKLVNEKVGTEPPRLYPTSKYLLSSRIEAPDDAIQAAIDKIAQAKRPVILAGNGVNGSKAYQSLRNFAEAMTIPVATTASGKGSFPETHELALGVFGNWGQTAANEYIRHSDVVLVLGSRLSPTDTCFENPALINPEAQFIIQVDIEPRNLSWTYPVQLPIIADVDAFLNQALKRGKTPTTAANRSKEIVLEKTKNKSFDEPEMYSDDLPMSPLRVIRDLGDLSDTSTVLFLDAGENRIHVLHGYKTRSAGSIYSPGGIGGMGYAIPSSISGKLVYPDKTCIALCGDGGFAMTMNGLLTAVQYDIRTITIILNDSTLGWVKNEQLHHNLPIIASEFGEFNYANISEAIGCRAWRVKTPSEFKEAFQKAKDSKVPSVIEVIVNGHPYWKVMSDYAKYPVGEKGPS